MSNVCNRDCFNCEYDDCIFDEITADDIKESKERDGDIKYYFMGKRQKKNREYRAANKDRIAAHQREYRATQAKG